MKNFAPIQRTFDRIRAISNCSSDVHVNKRIYMTQNEFFVRTVGQNFAVITIFLSEKKQTFFALFVKCRHLGSRCP